MIGGKKSKKEIKFVLKEGQIENYIFVDVATKLTLLLFFNYLHTS